MPADKGLVAGGEKEAPKKPKAKPVTIRRATQGGATKKPGRASLSGVGSASGGTILVAAVTKLPDSNLYKPWLLLFAPALTVVVLVVWTWLIEWVEKRNAKKEAERADKEVREKLETDIREAREAIDVALKGDHLSDEARAKFLQKREDLDDLITEIRVAKVRLRIEN